MRYPVAALTLVSCLLLLPAMANAEQSAVLLIIDGMGASYVCDDMHASFVNGGTISPVLMRCFANADALYTLRVAEPKTEIGHAVIATGYSRADSETVSFHDATIFDSVKKQGYLSIAIMEKGDSGYIIAEQDIAVHEKNNSVYDPLVIIEANGRDTPYDLAMMIGDYPALTAQKRGKDPYAAYAAYDTWALDYAAYTVSFMQAQYPGEKYLLTVNVGGADSAGHNLGYDGYSMAIRGVDGNISGLIDACRKSDTLLIITADHGMSFMDEKSRGSHSNEAVASRNESLLVPLLIMGKNIIQNDSGIYGQERLAPSLLALMGCRNTLSMCDGALLPGITSPYGIEQPDSAGNEKGAGMPAGYLLAGVIGATGIVVSFLILRKRR